MYSELSYYRSVSLGTTKMKFVTSALCIHLFFYGILAYENLIISLDDGLIQGSYKESYNGRKYMAFEGIPYARPPIGNLRFEDPQPIEPWSGILQAVNTYTCLQLDLEEKISGQEDCLYLNVYVPKEKVNLDDKLDVIVHMHGGAFMLGSPAPFVGPAKIMDRDVIYINFSYRVGVLGFYSLGDGRGNYGLKDQSAVLRWVQNNIHKFGGNKDSVTINGLSAGGVCVHLHYFSNLSEGLFHKGYAQSGMALNPWAIKRKPAVNAKKLASEVGCSDMPVDSIYECMKQRSGEQITKAVKTFYEHLLIPLVPFGPVVEKNSPSSFLTKLPYSQLVDKDVIDAPLLVSMTADEGTCPAAVIYGRVKEINENWKKWLPLLLEYYGYDQEKQDEISKKVKEYYFKNDPITAENYDILIKASTHRMFHLGGEKATKLHANATESNIYFFLINYVGEFFSLGNIEDFGINFGAGHGRDAKFYFSGTLVDTVKLTEKEVQMKDILLDIFASFAKTGFPKTDVADIQPVLKTEALNYLVLNGPDDMQMETTNGLGPHEFWSSLGLEEDENAIIN